MIGLLARLIAYALYPFAVVATWVRSVRESLASEAFIGVEDVNGRDVFVTTKARYVYVDYEWYRVVDDLATLYCIDAGTSLWLRDVRDREIARAKLRREQEALEPSGGGR